MKPYKSPRTRANWFVGLLGCFVVVVIASIISTTEEIRLLQQIQSGAEVADSWVESNDDRQVAIVGLYRIVFLTTAVAFLIWQYRASRNLAPLGSSEQRFSPIWAVGWWFVPIFNWFRPYQVTKEIWLWSHYLAIHAYASPQRMPGCSILGWWWAFHMIALLLSLWLTLTLLPSDTNIPTVDGLIIFAFISIASDLAVVAESILIFIVVRRITANQERAARQLGNAATEKQLPSVGV